jgi:hypothetical protein
VPLRLSNRACVLLTAAILLTVAALRVAFLLHCPLDLAPDEAHYWDWSRHLDWSYYSKGPLAAWVIRASCELLGGLSLSWTGSLAFAVRAPAVLFGTLLLTAIYILTVQTSRSHPLALATVLAFLTTPAVSAGSTLMTIDSPYCCLWAWALVLALHAARTDALWAWAAAGLAVCLGVLAKYTMAVFVPSLALYLLASPERRRLLARPGPWVFVLVAALSAVPVVAWNAAHDWVSFRHVAQISGAERDGVKWLGPLQLLAGQAALMLGAWLVLWLCALYAYRPTADADEGRQFLWWLSVPVFAVFLVASLKKGGGEINWPVTAYLSGGVLTAIWVSGILERGSPLARRAVTVTTAAGVALGLAGVALMHAPGALYPLLARVVGEPSDANPFPMRRLDPTCRLRGWRELAAEVDRARAELGEDAVIAGTGWIYPGLLGVYCEGNPRVVCLGGAQGERRSQYDLWENPIDHGEKFRGKTFLVVGVPSAKLKESFASVEELPVVLVRVAGQPVGAHGVWVCRGFQGVPDRRGGH